MFFKAGYMKMPTAEPPTAALCHFHYSRL